MSRRFVLWTSSLLLVLGLLVTFLARRQWDWLGSIENYERIRLERVLGLSAWYMKITFEHEVESLGASVRLPGGRRSELAELLAVRLEAWRRASRWPSLLEEVLLVTISGEAPPLVERFDPIAVAFERGEWSPPLEPLLEYASRLDGGRLFSPSPRQGTALRIVPGIPAVVVPTQLHLEEGEPRDALLAVRIDKEVLARELFPQLASMFLAPPNHDAVEVAVAETESGELVYSTLPVTSLVDFGEADVTFGLLDAGTDGRDLDHVGLQLPSGEEAFPRDRAAYPSWYRPPPEVDLDWFRELWARTFFSGHWQLSVRRGGVPFEAEVASARWRALATSFSALGLLCVAVGLLIVGARRAQRQARQQMEFVAGVSHELRTPLAILSAAGDNLGDCLVTEPKQLEEYGAVIKSETGRLLEMVENVLHVARKHTPAPQATMEPVEVAGLVRKTLQRVSRQLETSGSTTEQELPPGEIWVMGNARMLQSAILNLISNALKYGADAGWLRVSVVTGCEQGREEVEIAVEDRGTGIDDEDRPRIFDAFYRGRRARAEQIEGSGLGLAVVRDVVEAHHGRISVASSNHHGTTVTVHLPRLEGGP